MSMSIDDIWNTPLDATPPRTRKDVLAGEANSNTPARPSPAKRRRTTLFLSSDSENDAPSASTSKTSAQPTAGDKQKALIDSLFDDLDGDDFVDDGGFKELAPAPSIDELRRQAQASQRNRTRIPPSTPYEILPSSSPERDLGPGVGGSEERGGKGRKGEGEEGPKKRKPVPKLDETRLVSESGFPALIKQTKDFKPRGKGHELSDLNRVLGIYQFWTHKLYPKGTFHDNVQRIERLCHSKRMHNHLGMWRDASKGLINGRRPEDLEPLQDPDSDSDSASDQEPQPHDVPATTTTVTRSSSPTTRPPSSASSAPLPNDDVDDFDIEEMIREDEERQRRLAQSSSTSSSSSRPVQPTSNSATVPQAEPDEDQEMWDALDAGEEEVAVQVQQGGRGGGGGDDVEDEDMWDLVREIEESGGAVNGPPPVAVGASSVPAGALATATVSGAATASTVAGATTASSTTEVPTSTGQAPRPTSPKKPATNDEGWDEMYL